MAGKNVHSALENSIAVDGKIKKELRLGCVSGAYKTPPFDNLKSSPLALREISRPGQFRLLHNSSYPYDDTSVNFFISENNS